MSQNFTQVFKTFSELCETYQKSVVKKKCNPSGHRSITFSLETNDQKPCNLKSVISPPRPLCISVYCSLLCCYLLCDPCGMCICPTSSGMGMGSSPLPPFPPPSPLPSVPPPLMLSPTGYSSKMFPLGREAFE